MIRDATNATVCDNAVLTLTKSGYRLPTEAEWEYAAQGGTLTHGYTYSGSNTIGDVAWCNANSGSASHSVGTKAPNELGLYDMSGNVWAFCFDWYGSISSGTTETNPTGALSDTNRNVRGGCWYTSDDYAFSVFERDYWPYYDPSAVDTTVGFRVSMTKTE